MGSKQFPGMRHLIGWNRGRVGRQGRGVGEYGSAVVQRYSDRGRGELGRGGVVKGFVVGGYVFEPLQGCIKFLFHRAGKFIKFVGEEYKVVKKGREYHGCGKEY